jgi:type II secretory pathway pseudopilin PulG
MIFCNKNRQTKISIRNFPRSKFLTGFTLVEILVVLGIFVAIAIILGNFSRDIFFMGVVVDNSLAAEREGQQILQPMSNEFRSASASNTGAYPIAEASTSTITFFSDVNNDGLKERVRYFLAGAILKRGIIKPTGSPYQYLTANETISEMVHDIKNGPTRPIFDYYDTNYDGSSAPLSNPPPISSIRLVKITLYISKDPLHTPVPVQVTTQATLRNLKDNM